MSRVLRNLLLLTPFLAVINSINSQALALTPKVNDPTQGRGLFDGTYVALAQLAFQPNNNFTLGLTYLNNNISITPGLIVIFNPEHNSNNDTIYTGVVRTTFRF